MRRVHVGLGLVCAVALGAVLVSGCATSPLVRDASSVPQDTKAIEAAAAIPTKDLIPEETAAPAQSDSTAGSDGAAQPASAEEAFSVYRIGPGDMLGFRSFDDETLNAQVVVRYDGCISLPLIPDVNVKDKTRDEALVLVRDAYSMFYQDPQVSLVIVDPRSKKYYVMGDVTRPAEYPYTQPITLLDGITTAGGLRVNTQGGNSFVGAQGQLVKALIIRHTGAQRDVFEYDLRGLRKAGSHASDTPVLPGDIIYVPEGINLVYLLGQVRAPGVFALSEGMTLLRMLALAGGFDPATARLQQVVLIRQMDETTTKVMLVNVKRMLKTGEQVVLQAGDIIFVPQKPLVSVAQFVSRFTGSISPVMSLYRQAFDTYYTKKLYDQMFDTTSTDVFDFTALGRALGSIQSLVTGGTKLAPLGVAK